MPINPVGMNLSQAAAIPSSTTIKDRVSAKNPSDIFSFNLTNPGVLGIRFKSLGRSASLNLIQDANQNGVVDTGEVMQTLSPKARKNGKLDLADMAIGTYYLQVSTDRGSSPYRLKLSAAASSSPSEPENVPDFVRQVVDLTNQFRAKNGLAPLTLNSKLNAAAQVHSKNMAVQDFFGHQGMDGSSEGDRVSQEGYNWRNLAENIAAGRKTPKQVVEGWIKSPGHRLNILNPKVKDIGVGYFFLANDTGKTNYNDYWTQVFGEER
jgi:uncharacterized protein YkwD